MNRRPARNIDGAAPAAKRFFSSSVKIVFSLAVIALAFAATCGAARHSFAALDLVAISALALAVNIILLAAAAWLIRSRIIANAVMAGVVLTGLLTMHVVHMDIYRGGAAILIVLLGAAYVAVFVGLQAVDNDPWAGVVLAAMALAGIGVALFPSYYVPTIDQREIREITFEQRPNVYLVGFDGMAPATLLERFDVESTPFHDLMSSRFRVFRNFFTSNVFTMWAFNSLLTLDEEILKRYAAIPHLRLFAGAHDAPLFRLFRRNGYEITTLFTNQFFGSRGGPYIDNYVTVTPVVVCDQLDVAIRNLSFYGYCTIGAWLAEVVGARSSGSMEVEPSASANQRIVERILQRSELEQPQLVLAHIYCPGHASLHFDMHNQDDMAAFRAQYIADIDYAGELLAQIVDHLDPIVALDSQSIPLGLSGTASRDRFSRRNEAGEE